MDGRKEGRKGSILHPPPLLRTTYIPPSLVPSREIPARHARSRFFAPTTDCDARSGLEWSGVEDSVEGGRAGGRAFFLRVKLKYRKREGGREGGKRVGSVLLPGEGAMLVRQTWRQQWLSPLSLSLSLVVPAPWNGQPSRPPTGLPPLFHSCCCCCCFLSGSRLPIPMEWPLRRDATQLRRARRSLKLPKDPSIRPAISNNTRMYESRARSGLHCRREGEAPARVGGGAAPSSEGKEGWKEGPVQWREERPRRG